MSDAVEMSDSPGSFASSRSIGPHWHGWTGAKYFFVFGASYCDVLGYSVARPRPTPEHPLAVPWPGITFAEEGQPNWVGHLVNPNEVTKHAPLTFCYAVGGARVDNVKHQVETKFFGGGRARAGDSEPAATKPDWAPWTADDSLVATWVGINDVAWGVDAEEFVGKLMKQHDDLYDAGLRNFLWVNIPPLYHFPGRTGASPTPVHAWNTALANAVALFKERHPDSTTFLYSSFETFSRVFTDPVKFGFQEQDVRKRVGGIFVDGLHPTSAMHRIIAEDIARLLD